MTEDQLRHLRPDLLADHAEALRGDNAAKPAPMAWHDAALVIGGAAGLVWIFGLLLAGAVFGWW